MIITKVKIYIDLKPALSEEQLNQRILRDFESEKNKLFKNSLNDLLHFIHFSFINSEGTYRTNIIDKYVIIIVIIRYSF